jgi:hypothetical protein
MKEPVPSNKNIPSVAPKMFQIYFEYFSNNLLNRLLFSSIELEFQYSYFTSVQLAMTCVSRDKFIDSRISPRGVTTQKTNIEIFTTMRT